MQRYARICLFILASATLVTAQHPLNGTWEGETRNGTPLVLTLAVKDTVLTGTLVRSGQTAVIEDGTVSKNQFTFRATLNDQAERLSGEVSGDEIKIWLDRQGPSSAIVLTRVQRKQAPAPGSV